MSWRSPASCPELGGCLLLFRVACKCQEKDGPPKFWTYVCHGIHGLLHLAGTAGVEEQYCDLPPPHAGSGRCPGHLASGNSFQPVAAAGFS